MNTEQCSNPFSNRNRYLSKMRKKALLREVRGDKILKYYGRCRKEILQKRFRLF
jgi:hypothetical protein